ncbi:MAG: glycosyltransferase family 2 protein [Nitrososphaerota archaeon]|nr:glycosyltransferase family 2 protein [Nitrososphaerota archaeon]
MTIKVTVGLCVKNSARVIKTAFDSISAQDYPHEMIKLVIIDDNSTDNTLSVALKFAQEIDMPTFVTSNTGKGLAAARQLVVDNAEGEYIIWEDDDLMLRKDYVRRHVEFMEKNPDVGGARGVRDVFYSPSFFSLGDLVFLAPSANPSQIGTGGSIFRIDALKQAGGFDIQISGAGEDLDVSRRIRHFGWMLATNELAGLHHTHSTTTPAALWSRNFRYGYANHFLFHRYGDRRLIIQYFLPFALKYGLETSRKLYQITHIKKSFLYFVINSLNMGIQNLGYTRSHLDKYGH